MTTYTTRISYLDENEEQHVIEKEFDNIEGATVFVSGEFAHIMLEWHSINQYGVHVYGEVTNEDETFCDCYELICGM